MLTNDSSLLPSVFNEKIHNFHSLEEYESSPFLQDKLPRKFTSEAAPLNAILNKFDIGEISFEEASHLLKSNKVVVEPSPKEDILEDYKWFKSSNERWSRRWAEDKKRNPGKDSSVKKQRSNFPEVTSEGLAALTTGSYMLSEGACDLIHIPPTDAKHIYPLGARLEVKTSTAEEKNMVVTISPAPNSVPDYYMICLIDLPSNHYKIFSFRGQIIQDAYSAQISKGQKRLKIPLTKLLKILAQSPDKDVFIFGGVLG